MKTKNVIVHMTVVILIMGTTLVGCGSKKEVSSTQPTNLKPITLKLSEAQVDNYPDSIAERAFAKLVEERSKGHIKIDVITGGQLGDEKTTVEQTQVGIIDIGRANAGTLTPFADKLGIFSFPFLFDDRDHLWRVLRGPIGTELTQDLAKSNLITLAFYDAGARNFYTKKPVKTLDDLKGMKIRVIQNDILIEAFKKLGVSPTPMSASEVHGGLQTGVIDGGENNVSTYVADGLYEVAKNFTETGHLRIPGVLYMSKKSWDKLSSEDQKIIADAAKESEKVQLDEFDKYSMKATDKVKANGNEIITLAPADLQAIRDKVKPVFDKYQEKFGKFFEEIQKERKK